MDQEEQAREIEKLKKRVYKLEEENSQKLARIEKAILGDDQMNMKGMAKKVAEHEEHIEADKKLKNRAGGIISVLLFVLSALAAFINHLAGKIFK